MWDYTIVIERFNLYHVYKMKTVIIDGEEFVKKSEIKTTEMSVSTEWLPYTLVRTYSAWVFCGYVSKKKGKECTLLNARRLRYWSGASSLSQLAMEGVKKPKECKFPCEVANIELTEAIEYIPMTEEARLSIKSVPVWKQ